MAVHEFVRSKSFTRIIFIGISSSPCSLRGVSGDVPEAERGAAPAGRARDPALGRPGAPPGGHYGPPAESRLIRPAQAVLESAARAEKSRGGAPKGAPASVIGRLISGLITGDRPYREAGHGCGVPPPAPVGALPPAA